jgi:hypothetical protein
VFLEVRIPKELVNWRTKPNDQIRVKRHPLNLRATSRLVDMESPERKIWDFRGESRGSEAHYFTEKSLPQSRRDVNTNL